MLYGVIVFVLCVRCLCACCVMYGAMVYGLSSVFVVVCCVLLFDLFV